MDLRDKLSSLDVPPSKILKIVLGLALVLLLMWVFTLSQIDYNQGPDAQDYINSKAKADSSQIVAPQKNHTEEIRSQESSPSLFTNGLTTFLVLLGLLIIVWFWIGRKQSSGPKVKQREMENHVLGEGAKLKIIQINQEVWVIGVTASSVDLLYRYPQEEWTEEVPEEDSENKDVFRKLFKSQMS